MLVVDIFDEVSDDLRAERAQALLRRYGAALVVLALVIVAAVAGWQAWQWRQKQQAGQVADRYIAAMNGATATPAGPAAPAARDKSAAEFAGLAATAPEGYRTLARLQDAAIRASSNDLPAALSLWDQVSSDTTADPLLRSLADLLWVQHQVDTGAPDAVEGRLAPLLAPDSPWRALARESQAWLYLRMDQAPRAQAVLKQLAADATAPDGVRNRARGLLTRLGEPPEAPNTNGGAPR